MGDIVKPAPRGRPWTKPLVVLVLLASVALLYRGFGDAVSLAKLAEKETALRQFQQQHPVLVYVAAFAAYVVVTGLSLPGATVMSLAIGWYFGFLPALILISFASTLGATIACSLCRFLLRDAVQARIGHRMTSFHETLDREGAFYLFTLRLIPAVPFWLVNLAMGLTRIPLVTFWWVSQVGMLPGTCVYVYAGSSLPRLARIADQQPILNARLLLAFALLGLFPITAKRIIQRIRGTRESRSDRPRKPASRPPD